MTVDLNKLPQMIPTSFSVEIQLHAGFKPLAVALGWHGLSRLRLRRGKGLLGRLGDFSVERQFQRGELAPC